LAVPIAVTTLVSMLVGCAAGGRRKSLELVAKDWCETIRASQVIPVYPLTEDLRPGDVFLVQTSVAAEADRYKKRGFLALDDFRTRLDLRPGSYRSMYFDGYWTDGFASDRGNPRPRRAGGPYPEPKARLAEPTTTGNGTSAASDAGAERAPLDSDTLLSEANVPRVAFPTYTFDISTSSGLGLALPIKGIPVALGFLRADRAIGTVTLADARTYAADPGIVYERLKVWAEVPDVKTKLSSAASRSRDPVFVRVICRVYLVGAVNVSVSRKAASAADAKAGKAPVVDLINENGDVDPRYKRTLGALNETAPTRDAAPAPAAVPAPTPASAEDASPTLTPVPTPSAPAIPPTLDWANAGGTFRFTSLSSSSVSLAETFDTLLAFGYLGFDAPVYEDGTLGEPIPTFQRLEGLVPSRVALAGRLTAGENSYKVVERVLESEHREPTRTLEILGKLLPKLPSREFANARRALHAARCHAEGGDAATALRAFLHDAKTYVSAAGGETTRGQFLLATFAEIYGPLK